MTGRVRKGHQDSFSLFYAVMKTGNMSGILKRTTAVPTPSLAPPRPLLLPPPWNGKEEPSSAWAGRENWASSFIF